MLTFSPPKSRKKREEILQDAQSMIAQTEASMATDLKLEDLLGADDDQDWNAAAPPVASSAPATSAPLITINSSNLQDCVQIINDALASMDYGNHQRQIHLPTRSQEDVLVLADVLYSLVQNRRSYTKSQDATLDRIGKLESDQDLMQSRVKQLSEALEAAEREVALKEEKTRTVQVQWSQAQRAWEAEKAEMQKEIVTLQHRDNQYQHEIRKKERELEKVQKKLQAALGDRSRDSKGMEVQGPAALAQKAIAAKQTKTVRCSRGSPPGGFFFFFFFFCAFLRWLISAAD